MLAIMKKDPGYGEFGGGSPIRTGVTAAAVYRLACIFAASQEFARISRRYPGLARHCIEFQNAEASHQLLCVAAIVRRTLAALSPSAQSILDKPVGQLQFNVRHPEQANELKLRDACSRILQADEIELLRDKLKNGAIVLDYTVVLTGRTDGESWRATLDVLQFLELISMIV